MSGTERARPLTAASLEKGVTKGCVSFLLLSPWPLHCSRHSHGPAPWHQWLPAANPTGPHCLLDYQQHKAPPLGTVSPGLRRNTTPAEVLVCVRAPWGPVRSPRHGPPPRTPSTPLRRWKREAAVTGAELFAGYHCETLARKLPSKFSLTRHSCICATDFAFVVRAAPGAPASSPLTALPSTE